MTIQRCGWCSDDPLYIAYHDLEWGKPLKDEARLFEMLCLEGQQAGLSWITVLKKREAYRELFFQYPIQDIAQLSDEYLAQCCLDARIIRHIDKLNAIRTNAIAWQNLKAQGIDPVTWLWSFVEGQTHVNDVENYKTAPAQTELSQHISKVLKKRGFKFVGPTIVYALMQAIGMVNDHENHCAFKSISTE